MPFLNAAQLPGRQEAIKHVNEGDNLMRTGRWEIAENAYSNAIAADPDFADAYMKRALLYRMTGRYGQAESDYQKAMAINPYSEYIYDQRAALKMMATDYRGALDDINKAIALNSDNNELVDFRIEDYVALEQYEKALKDIDRLIEDGHNVETEYLKKAYVSMLNDDPALFKSSIDAVLAQNEQSAIAFDLLGLFELRKGAYGAALKHFDKAIALDSELDVAYFNRAVANRHLGRPQQALNDLNTAIAISQNKAHILFTRAVIKKELGDVRGSLDDYDVLISNNDCYLKALYNRAFSHKYLGDYQNALNDAEQILKINPDGADHWNLNGNIQLLYGNTTEAIRMYSEAIFINNQYAEAYYNRGLAYIMQYRSIEGCNDLQRSIDLGYERAQPLSNEYCR